MLLFSVAILSKPIRVVADLIPFNNLPTFATAQFIPHYVFVLFLICILSFPFFSSLCCFHLYIIVRTKKKDDHPWSDFLDWYLTFALSSKYQYYLSIVFGDSLNPKKIYIKLFLLKLAFFIAGLYCSLISLLHFM